MKVDKKILSELNFVKYNQLHNVTLNISNQCFDIKKNYLTILSLFSTLCVSLITANGINIEVLNNLKILYCLLIITLSFYLYDSYLYYYQKKLRIKMNGIEKLIGNNCIDETLTEHRLVFKSLINPSHLFYIIFLFMINIFWLVLFGFSNDFVSILCFEIRVFIAIGIFYYLLYSKDGTK